MNDIRPVTQVNIKPDGINKKDSPAGLKKALQEFEALFINQMLKTMRETVMKSGLFHGGNGEDMYTSLFDAELSRLMAQSGGIGLEKTFIKQLTKEYMPSAEKDNKSNPFPGEELTPREVEPLKLKIEEKRDGIFKYPVHGPISSNFGFRKDPFTKDIKFHHGIDIAAEEGSPVYPAAEGKVVFSGSKDGYGNIIEIMHEDGYVTRYGHNSKNLVKQGDTVTPVEAIAYVGSSGRSTGAHLHFEVIKDGLAIDPGKLFYG